MTIASIDGNEAAARVAHRLSEVVAIYPITPASAMGEHADAWSAEGRPNLWGVVPEVIEMQSEAGAAGVLHGAAQKGALATTFTASQGLLLMLPNLYKLGGELLPCVVHVAARTIATHALSIFGDHSDVMAARMTGLALLASSSVQEAHDMTLVAHAAALRSRVPFLHFFDGFRTSHETTTVTLLDDDDLRALVDEDMILAHRARGLSPDHPVLRGSAQNPDVFFQAREAANPYYLALPKILEEKLALLGTRTGRHYKLVEYEGAPDAERVIVLMGSASGAARETARELRKRGEKVGVLTVRLYRPFPAGALFQALPSTVKAIAVLDRTKEPGAVGDPLYLDVVTSLVERGGPIPKVIGGRYGLSSKECTPAMLKAVFDALAKESPPRHFTLGVIDDVTRTSLPYDSSFSTEHAEGRAIFYGVGSDGTVSASKSSAKIFGDEPGLFAQAYSVYDSRKSGQLTTSHLRYAKRPIESTYLLSRASFVGVHRFSLLERVDVLEAAERGAKVLLNAQLQPADVWQHLPKEVQDTILEKELRLFAIDADAIAASAGLGDRINTIMQAAFFALDGGLPKERAIEAIRRETGEAYKKHGEAALAKNYLAIERGFAEVAPVPIFTANGTTHRRDYALLAAPDFVRRVTARLLAGQGDLLPVSAFPPDGTFPTGTARWEKRGLADSVPIWDPSLCIDCGKCTLVCPHSALRMKVYDAEEDAGELRQKPFKSREAPGLRLTIQLSPDDCTGCELCVHACPVVSKTDPKHRSINMEPIGSHAEIERKGWERFLAIDEVIPEAVAKDTVKGTQLRPPLFEFSGACAGCGETPYLKLLTQLFGDRIVIANATGCSSIFGGNLPTTPWTTNREGRGPAWANSLFEDNAEFGLGMRVALERQMDEAQKLLGSLGETVGEELVRAVLSAPQTTDAEIKAQRARLDEVRIRLEKSSDPRALRLASIVDNLAQKSVWIVGGDGWAYDIGFGGLDHVLASGRDVNVLVLDTEVYSNTGGQASKATPRGAIAKFAASGKPTAKKDLGRIAMTYEGVYVAQIAFGADDRHTIRALMEAAAWKGPSLVIAYSPCIAHGIEMCNSLDHQKAAASSGYWPLYRYDPLRRASLHLDVKGRTGSLEDFERSEARFGVTRKDLGDGHVHLLALSGHDVDERWRVLEDLQGTGKAPA